MSFSLCDLGKHHSSVPCVNPTCLNSTLKEIEARNTVHSTNPGSGEPQAGDLSEFKASLLCKVSSRTAYRNTVSKNQKQKTKNQTSNNNETTQGDRQTGGQ